MLLRGLSFLLGLSLVLAVVYLGYRTTEDASVVVWFGLASAILVPLGFAAMSFAVSAPDRDAIRKLAKVPEIDKLIAEAETQEERIRLLDEQRKLLAKLVEHEATKQSLYSRKQALENEASRLLAELNLISNNLGQIEGDEQLLLLSDDATILKQRIIAKQRGDLVLKVGKRQFVIERRHFRAVPLMELYLDLVLWLVGSVDKAISRRS